MKPLKLNWTELNIKNLELLWYGPNTDWSGKHPYDHSIYTTLPLFVLWKKISEDSYQFWIS